MLEILGIVVWLGSIFACYFIAEQNNRNAVGWAIGGAFFGIFALLLVALLPRLPKSLKL